MAAAKTPTSSRICRPAGPPSASRRRSASQSMPREAALGRDRGSGGRLADGHAEHRRHVDAREHRGPRGAGRAEGGEPELAVDQHPVDRRHSRALAESSAKVIGRTRFMRLQVAAERGVEQERQDAQRHDVAGTATPWRRTSAFRPHAGSVAMMPKATSDSGTARGSARGTMPWRSQ